MTFGRTVIVAVLLLLPCVANAVDLDATNELGNIRPNVVFILADGLGFGDLGVTNQNARQSPLAHFITPHLDALAVRGMLLRQHYTGAPDSAPARASLLLGQHQGDCAIRDNQIDRPIPNNHTLATVLKAAGYHTVAIGNWGLPGMAPQFPGHPMKHGFDEFFGTLTQDAGHAYYADAAHPLMDGLDDVSAKYSNSYETDLFTARAKKFLSEHQAAHPEQPFFVYLSYAAPHAPESLAGGPYPEGGVHWPLTATPSTKNSWLPPEYDSETYEPSPGKSAPWTSHMKRYAAVIRRLDDAVGDVVQTLRDLNLDKNTLVVFTSSTGPSNEGNDPRSFDSAGPFDGYKRDLWEGGIREPAIACWPGHIPDGVISDVITQSADWMPTLADFARLIPPAETDGVSLKPTLLEQPGQRDRGFYYSEYSFPTDAHPKGPLADVLARKHATGRGQQQMLRIGDFVAIRTNIQKSDDPLRLYNVITDPHEDDDLAQDPDYSGVMQRMRSLLSGIRRPDATLPRPYDDVPLPGEFSSGTVGAIKADTFPGDWPWVPDLDSLNPVRSTHARGFELAPPGAPDDPFAMRFTGAIVVPTTGKYTFWLTTDTGAELWLHEAHLIDDDFKHTGNAVEATVNLAAGAHPFRLFYRHKFGTPNLTLEYAGPSIARQPVPVSELRMPG